MSKVTFPRFSRCLRRLAFPLFFIAAIPCLAEDLPETKRRDSSLPGLSPAREPESSTSGHDDASPNKLEEHIHEIWFFYLSSLALTITAGSTLLVAIAVIRMQSFAAALSAIERSAAEAFHKIDKLDDYTLRTCDFSLNERWREYFDAVQHLTEAFGDLFSGLGRYTETKAFVLFLVAQGHKIDQRNRRLQKAMMPVFVATAALAGIGIVSLPAVQWLTPSMLMVTWITSAAISVLLLMFFLHIIYSAFRHS
jgi:hypothetical protein